MKKIKYFSYYGKRDNKQNRQNYLAASNKIDYICEILIKLGYSVDIISASGTLDKKKYYAGSYTKLDNNKYLKMFCTFPKGNILQRIINKICVNFSVFYELLKIKKNDNVIVYHSLGYMRAVQLAHFVKRFRLILEVEEIYSDVLGKLKTRKKELNFFKQADSFIFPTEMLNDEVNPYRKPHVIIYGTYKVETDRCKCVFNDKKKKEEIIHCVYAGTFESKKGGAAVAVAAGAFLPSNYHIHILGFGSASDTESIIKLVDETNKKAKASITYHGVLSGEEYIKFIQSCDIGLSTQNPYAAFNNTSFPSKVLSYLSNGLNVVSIRIPVLEHSKVGKVLYYYENQTPENVAKAIMDVPKLNNYDCRELIMRLSDEFEKDLQHLLEN